MLVCSNDGTFCSGCDVLSEPPRSAAGPLDLVVHSDVSTPYLDADVRAAVDRLRTVREPLDRYRSGSWFVTAAVRGEVVGCARAVRAPGAATGPFSPGLRALGPDRYAEWLAGGLELTDVAVDARYRHAGVGAHLLRAALTPAVRRNGWAQLCGPDLSGAGTWFRRQGWTVVAADRDGVGVVVVEPRHPAARRPPSAGRCATPQP